MLVEGMDALVLRGDAEITLHCHCDRCRGEFGLSLPANDICHAIENTPDIIDLTDFVREDILLSFPQHYLCESECLGLCPGCGVNLNREDCCCTEDEESSPFLDALDDIKFEE